MSWPGNQLAVQQFLKSEKPDEVILAAAKSAESRTNTYPAEFIIKTTDPK